MARLMKTVYVEDEDDAQWFDALLEVLSGQVKYLDCDAEWDVCEDNEEEEEEVKP